MIRQLLTESLVLALAGGAAGVLLANGGVELLKQLGPQSMPRLDEVHLNGVVLAFTFATAIFTGILFGLGPAVPVPFPRGSIHLRSPLEMFCTLAATPPSPACRPRTFRSPRTSTPEGPWRS